MPYYTAELHYIGPMIAFIVDDHDGDDHAGPMFVIVDVNDDDKHGENAIGQVCYNDIDNHADDDHDVGPMIAFVVDDDDDNNDGVNAIGGYNDVDNHGDDDDDDDELATAGPDRAQTWLRHQSGILCHRTILCKSHTFRPETTHISPQQLFPPSVVYPQ